MTGSISSKVKASTEGSSEVEKREIFAPASQTEETEEAEQSLIHRGMDVVKQNVQERQESMVATFVHDKTKEFADSVLSDIITQNGGTPGEDKLSPIAIFNRLGKMAINDINKQGSDFEEFHTISAFKDFHYQLQKAFSQMEQHREFLGLPPQERDDRAITETRDAANDALALIDGAQGGSLQAFVNRTHWVGRVAIGPVMDAVVESAVKHVHLGEIRTLSDRLFAYLEGKKGSKAEEWVRAFAANPNPNFEAELENTKEYMEEFLRHMMGEVSSADADQIVELNRDGDVFIEIVED